MGGHRYTGLTVYALMLFVTISRKPKNWYILKRSLEARTFFMIFPFSFVNGGYIQN